MRFIVEICSKTCLVLHEVFQVRYIPEVVSRIQSGITGLSKHTLFSECSTEPVESETCELTIRLFSHT